MDETVSGLPKKSAFHTPSHPPKLESEFSVWGNHILAPSALPKMPPLAEHTVSIPQSLDGYVWVNGRINEWMDD